MMPEFIPAELVDYVKTSPLLVRSVILLSILFIFSSIFLALVVTINRLSKIVKIRKENLFSEYCVDFITEWAYNFILGPSLIHIWRCRPHTLCSSRWSPYPSKTKPMTTPRITTFPPATFTFILPFRCSILLSPLSICRC